MKTSHLAAHAAIVGAILALATPLAFAQGNSGNAPGQQKKTMPAMPAGWLSAFPTIVQTGTHPTLNWEINHPSHVHDYVEIEYPGTLNPKEEVDVEVRVLGNGVTVTYSNGNWAWVPAEARISFNGGSYDRIFYGTNSNVNPNTVVWSKTKVRAGQRLRFGGRYYWNNNWGPWFNSNSSVANVRTLADGDTPPFYETQAADIPTLEDFIEPYLDHNNKVKIGPLDVIVFMELTHTNEGDSGYDMQDMVLLVTFKTRAKNNNGHGNNIDGVDSSNPGNAPFINLDTDPNFDDEGGGGGAAPSNP